MMILYPYCRVWQVYHWVALLEVFAWQAMCCLNSNFVYVLKSNLKMGPKTTFWSKDALNSPTSWKQNHSFRIDVYMGKSADWMWSSWCWLAQYKLLLMSRYSALLLVALIWISIPRPVVSGLVYLSGIFSHGKSGDLRVFGESLCFTKSPNFLSNPVHVAVSFLPR